MRDGGHEAKPKTAPFASYVEGYFEGKVRVQSGVVGALERLFEDDRQPVEVVQCCREQKHESQEGTKDLVNDGWKVGGSYRDRDHGAQAAPPKSNPTTYLDKAWRELLEGKHPLVQPTPPDTEPPIRPQDHAEVSDDRHQDELSDDDNQEVPLDDHHRDELSENDDEDELSSDDGQDEWLIRREAALFSDLAAGPLDHPAVRFINRAEPTELSDDQAFWFLALLDQWEYHRQAQESTTGPTTRAEVAGIALPRSQFVSLRLCCPPSLARRRREVLNSPRLIFTRSRPAEEEAPPVGEGPQAAAVPPPRKHVRLPSDPALSWAPRADDRRTTNLKPRKKQKLADVFSGFGM